MNKNFSNQTEYWNSLSELDPDASVIDPKDTLGFKNSYIASVRDFYFLKCLPRIEGEGILLDFGCGTGSAAISLQRHGYQIIGIDISEKLIRIAKNRCEDSAKFILIDGLHVPFKSNSFSAAIDYVVLSYVVDDDSVVRLLTEIKNALMPDATFIMIEQARRSRREADAGLKVQRSHEEWVSLFQQAGFKYISGNIIRYGRFPFTYLIRMGIVPKFLWPILIKAEWLTGIVFGFLPWDYAEVLYEVKA